MSVLSLKRQLNFTNMFAHLRNSQKIDSENTNTLSTFFSKKRPKSMYVHRFKTQQDKKSMRKTFYSTNTLTRRNNQNTTKVRFFTQESENNKKYSTSQNQKKLKYLAINNFCLKKIPIEGHLPQSQTKLKINQLSISIVKQNPQNHYYRKKILRSYKKNKMSYHFRKATDISTRIQGFKIF